MKIHSHLQLNKVALLSVIMGTAGMLFPVIVLKINRVDSGTAMGMGDIPGTVGYQVLGVALLAVGAVLCVLRKDQVPSLTWYGIGLLLGVSALQVLVLSGTLAAQFPAGRVSPAVGFWLLAASIVTFMGKSIEATPRPQWVGYISVGVVVIGVLAFGGRLSHLSILKEFNNNQSRFFQDLLNHMVLSLTAVAIAIGAGVPLGIIAWRKKLLERGIFAVVNSIQTIPSLALFGIIIAPLSILSFRFPLLRTLGIKGVGNTPALIALTLYALLPIVQNTYSSLANIRRSVIDAGRGMGMTKYQMLFQLEIPIALPILVSGVRTSLVQTIGNTTVAALIGAAGLGTFIFQGLGQAAPDLVYLGMIPIIIIAITTDRLFAGLIKAISLPIHAELI